MIENLQDELYHLENKQTKGAKLGANITQPVDHKKCSKIGAKLVSNCKQNMSYNESRKNMSMLTSLKLSSLPIKCANFTDQNIIQRGEGPHGTEF